MPERRRSGVRVTGGVTDRAGGSRAGVAVRSLARTWQHAPEVRGRARATRFAKIAACRDFAPDDLALLRLGEDALDDLHVHQRHGCVPFDGCGCGLQPGRSIRHRRVRERVTTRRAQRDGRAPLGRAPGTCGRRRRRGPATSRPGVARRGRPVCLCRARRGVPPWVNHEALGDSLRRLHGHAHARCCRGNPTGTAAGRRGAAPTTTRPPTGCPSAATRRARRRACPRRRRRPSRHLGQIRFLAAARRSRFGRRGQPGSSPPVRGSW